MAKDAVVPGKKMKDPAMLRCSCKHEHQDQVLGKGIRFCNYSPKKDKHSCTVCGKDI